MKGHGAKFGRKKEQAIAALLSHRSVEDAARAIGLDPNTLLRWLDRNPSFSNAYLKARREASTRPSRGFSRPRAPLATPS